MSGDLPVKSPIEPTKDCLYALTILNTELGIMESDNVLIRKDYKDLSKPRIFSGGCPSQYFNYANFVGTGLLTAAILGDIDISPSTQQILHTLHELCADNTNGVMMIIPSTSDAFSFGLAYKRAISNCLRVKMIVVKDSEMDKNTCGFIVLLKIAGAMAECDKTLDQIVDVCAMLNENLISVFIPPLPVIEKPSTLSLSSLEPRPIYNISLEEIINSENLNLPPDNKVILFLNSFDLAKVDELILIKRIVDRFIELKIIICRFYVGRFYGSSSMSLTILKYPSAEIFELVEYPTTALGWPHFNQVLKSELTFDPPIPTGLENKGVIIIPMKGPKLNAQQTKVMECCLYFACDALISCEKLLNKMDGEYSKGNIGSRFKRTAERIKQKMVAKKIATSYPFCVLKKLSVVIERGLSGILGSIYGYLLEAAACAMENLDETQALGPETWMETFDVSLDAFTKICSDEKRMTSMYFPYRAFHTLLTEEYDRTKKFPSSLNMAVYGTEKAVERTKPTGCLYADAGAQAFAIWLRAISEGVKLELYPDK